MYQHSYAEVLEDDQQDGRRIEVQALDQVIALLRLAAALPPSSFEGVRALHATCELWMTFMAALAAPENALPDALRANLISIGVWILKEAEAIRHGRSSNYAGIADICIAIRDGLR